MLRSLKKPFSVIGISETWLTDCTAELVNITGYNFVSNHRKSKTGGGVGIYLQDDLQYKLLNECKLSDPETIESLFVEITVPHGKNIIVGFVYRPPNQNTALFLDKFNDILSRIFKDNKQCYVMGDFNLDLLQYNHHTPTQEFIDTLFSHAFIPLISNPTRLTSYSATLIDNIFRNNLSQNVLNSIALNDSSDHLPVLLIFLAKPWRAMEKIKYSYARFLTKICINSTKTFHTQTGPHFLMKIPIWLTIILKMNTRESTMPASL